ncbi:phosphatase PAP2 family protein [Actinobacillus porcinus]|uniref:undecaprenyl-diphosphate phosphatase n=1 Tax=Actinobacillus porcinus TaxID=51048 RepID=A0ABY6TIV0_9PAST|nr:phosphatase PAP2 family protein [Actinobacillus porcinus]MDD7545481.1 phosphatase PAP2 family protein [Actinobacillus porcinus]MDY5849177.1 phosphatase PAP2 family protein [Actinobacillus porcinus]VFY92853.1 phosphatidylglycerophosphatase [Actinobacillus porcinus]VTU07321.1 phosphatidylglycerophosphatase [Actinobacillus porcinus]
MLKRLSLYTFLLCLVPIFVWIFSWAWAGDNHLTQFDHFLYWLTETGSVPYAVISCAVFALLFYPIFPNRKKWMLGVGVMVLSMVATQGIKTVAKNAFAEPRPYVVQFEEQSGMSSEAFYALPRNEREVVIHHFYAAKTDVPTWLAHHRENETGYSFPSGHAIFAAAWLLLAVGFTEFYGRCRTASKLLVAGTLIWAVLMLVSRLRLGMHYPIDLFASILIAWIVHGVIFTFLAKKAIFIKE